MIRKSFSNLQRKVSLESLKLYSFNLRDKIPDITPKVTIDVVDYTRPLKLENLKRETVEERILYGDQIFVACHKSKPVAYLFVTTTRSQVCEIDDTLLVGSNEVYLYDAFTSADYRGNRIFPALISNAASFFKERSYSYALIFVTSSNINSIRGVKRAGFSCYQIIHFYNFFGFKIWNYTARSRYVQSRFSNED